MKTANDYVEPEIPDPLASWHLIPFEPNLPVWKVASEANARTDDILVILDHLFPGDYLDKDSIVDGWLARTIIALALQEGTDEGSGQK